MDMIKNLNEDYTLEKNVERQFEKTLLSFLMYEPFFADIVRMLKKQPTNSIATAGVGFDGISVVLYYNPKFLSTLTNKQVFGLLKHECYHIIYKHITSRKKDPHIVWNIATDLAINCTIPRNELPAGGLIPGRPIKSPDNPNDDIRKAATSLSRFIETLPPYKTSEWYFDKIMSDEEAKQAIEEMFQGNASCAGSNPGDSKPGEESDGQQPGGGGIGSGIGFDHHFDLDQLDQGDKEYVEAKIEEIVKKAAERANEQRSWGSVPHGVSQKIIAALFKGVSWKDVLRYFCGTKQRANKSRSFKKINRKYPYQHPGRKIGRTSNIAVYIDQSGSVSEAELQMFFSTLNDLAKKTTFTIFHFDCTVDEKSKYIWKKNKKIQKAYRTRGGGTDFTRVEEFHRKIQGEYDGYIIFTDGEAPKPLICKSKRCWVLLPYRDLAFTPHKNDVVVKMSAT